jgi:hypothetical protein
MKVVITESRLFDAIYNYIDNMYDVSELTLKHPEVWDDEEMSEIENSYVTDFYDYNENLIFSYFEKEYYGNDIGSKFFKDSAPILEVNGYDWQRLTSMFGNNWKEPMKKSFEDKFGLPVNTVTIE